MHRRTSELRQALTGLKAAIIYVVVLSALVNVLTLGGSMYMMLVYDSVLPSRSIATLVGLLAIVLIVYLFQGLFEAFRSRLLNETAIVLEQQMSTRVQDAAFASRLRSQGDAGVATGAVRDLDTIRVFLSGPGPGAFIDAPWIVFFLLVLAILHIWLAVAAFCGACIMVMLTFLTYRASDEPMKKSVLVGLTRQSALEERLRHAETIHVLGMAGRLRQRWENTNRGFLEAQDVLARTTSFYGGISRIFRVALQSIILTVGALLVIDDKASGGVIFASSILSARALAPIDQIIAQWRNFASARASWTRLEEFLAAVPAVAEVAVRLPTPSVSLALENCFVAPPGTQRITVQGVSLILKPGDVLGILGPSGSGKSSLAKAIVGAWQPVRGAVRLDGATLDQFCPEQLGAAIGYLPQTVELLRGTVGENIARFELGDNSEAVVRAAEIAGVHDLVVSMPKGYDFQVGVDGEQLSGGQRQRLALARTLYKDPFLVVLDEPNANLDASGEAALDAAIVNIQARGGICVVVAHRGAVLKLLTRIVYLMNGAVQFSGPADKVLAQITRQSQTPPGPQQVEGSQVA